MARYRVRRTFPAHHPVKVGQLLEDPNYRNLKQLVSQGYLEEVAGRMLGAGPAAEPPAELVEEVVSETVEPVHTPAATSKSKSKSTSKR